MINCPRCQHPVDEKMRVTCPICFSQLNADEVLAQSAGASGNASGASPNASSAVPFSAPHPSNNVSLPTPVIPGFAPAGSASPNAPSHPGFAIPSVNPSPSPGYQPPTLPMNSAPSASQANSASTGAPTRTRVSLTGEVIEDQSPQYSPPGAPGATSSPLYGTGSGPMPGPLPLSSSAFQTSATPAKKSSNFLGIAFGGTGIILYILFRVAMVALRFTHPWNSDSSESSSNSGRSPFNSAGSVNPYKGALSDPKSAAFAAIESIHTQNWDKLYYVSAFEANESKTPDEKNVFVKTLADRRTEDHNPLSLFNVMAAAKSADVGNGDIAEGKSDVPTKWVVNVDGKPTTFHGIAHMIYVKNMWLLDSTGSMSRTYDDLLGTSDADNGSGSQANHN